MKREIKFRAWNTVTGKMMNWQDIQRFGNLQKILKLDHIIVMQFTGLCDKNGKEIYEGDIVKYSIGIRDVFWHKCGFSIKINNEVVGPIFHEEGEILGNIYENPELLK